MNILNIEEKKDKRRYEGAIDAFFTDVLVNSEDKAVRENRLFMLHSFRALVQRVADFSGVEG